MKISDEEDARYDVIIDIFSQVVNITNDRLEDRRTVYGWHSKGCAVLDPFCSKIQGGENSTVHSLNKNLKNEVIPNFKPFNYFSNVR